MRPSTPRLRPTFARIHLLLLMAGSTAGYSCGASSTDTPPARSVETASRLQGLDQTLSDCSTPSAAAMELINAISMANAAGAGAHTITLASDCTYTLTTAENYWYGPNALPAITGDITIRGQGASIIERSSAGGTPKFRLFYA